MSGCIGAMTVDQGNSRIGRDAVKREKSVVEQDWIAHITKISPIYSPWGNLSGQISSLLITSELLRFGPQPAPHQHQKRRGHPKVISMSCAQPLPDNNDPPWKGDRRIG